MGNDRILHITLFVTLIYISIGMVVLGEEIWSSPKLTSRDSYSILSDFAKSEPYDKSDSNIQYFFNSNGQIIASVRNLKTSDFGETKVEIDDSEGSSLVLLPKLEGKKHPPTIRITPTSNRSNADVKISVYYSPYKLGQWQSKKLDKANIFKLVSQYSPYSDTTKYDTAITNINEELKSLKTMLNGATLESNIIEKVYYLSEKVKALESAMTVQTDMLNKRFEDFKNSSARENDHSWQFIYFIYGAIIPIFLGFISILLSNRRARKFIQKHLGKD